MMPLVLRKLWTLLVILTVKVHINESIINFVTEFVSANVTTLATEANTTLSEISTESSKQEDTSNYQVAFWISAFLLGLASAVHLFAFFVKKAHATKKTPSPSHVKA